VKTVQFLVPVVRELAHQTYERLRPEIVGASFSAVTAVMLESLKIMWKSPKWDLQIHHNKGIVDRTLTIPEKL